MNRLISVHELKEWVKNWFDVNRNYHPYSKQNNIPIPELYDILERMPTIEERKRGEWIKMPYHVTECSECGFSLEDWIQGAFYNYCPNCGTDMRGKGHETD